MKRFCILSMIALLFIIDGSACIVERSTYNYYMFSVFRRETMNDHFTNQFDGYWEQYTNGEVTSYLWNKDRVMETARHNGDGEMMAYLTRLNEYLHISDQLKESWSYPTKEELAQRKTTLQQMIKDAQAYRGTRLVEQWLLLQMRANMVLGNHQANITLWNTQGSKQRKSVYREMMENIYAGALLRIGKRIQACNIYAAQEDMVSIKWAMRKHRNLAGIKSVYAEDANSPALNFLVQDFVNNAQETMDSEEDWLQMIDARTIKQPEIIAFITFADEVLASGKTQSPALWKAAIGELQYLMGQHDAAMNTLEQAMGMAGTQRMKDNARAIRAIVSVKGAKADSNYERFIVEEMKWLIAKAKEEGLKDNHSTNHYTELLERLVYNNLAPMYYKANNLNIATGLNALMDDRTRLFALPKNKENRSDWNPNYSSLNEYYSTLDTLSAEELANYFAWTKANAKGEMEQFLKQYITVDDDFFNDFIGTRYMAEGQFAKAKDWLQKVPLRFMEGQNICYYLANRKYTLPRWFGRQSKGFSEEEEGPFRASLNTNPKLTFCQDILKKEELFKTAKGEQRTELAYELAVNYYQASYLGECWFLTHYAQSVIDTVRTGEMDFVSKAVDYLSVSKKSKNMKIRANSLYALAYIPTDPWMKEVYDYTNNSWTTVTQTASRQYRALNELYDFSLKNAKHMSPIMTRCDVLKQFRKYR